MINSIFEFYNDSVGDWENYDKYLKDFTLYLCYNIVHDNGDKGIEFYEYSVDIMRLTQIIVNTLKIEYKEIKE